MAVVPLKIFIHGLIALAPSSDPGNSAQFTALLVDATRLHSAAVQFDAGSHGARIAGAPFLQSADCEAEHWPELRFAIPTTAEAAKRCQDADCKVRNASCECQAEALVGKKIWIEADLAAGGPQTQLSEQAPGEVPENAVQAGNLGYIANLTREPFSLALRSDYLSEAPPPHLLARMAVPFTRVTACSLAMRWDKGTKNIHPLAFRHLGDVGDASEKSQALAQMVVAEADLAEVEGGLPQVKVKIQGFGSSDVDTIEVRAGSAGFVIFLSNAMKELSPGQPCDDGIARHFAHFFPLASNPPLPAAELIPHLRYLNFRFSGGMEPEACKFPTSTMNDRPICPMASFF